MAQVLAHAPVAPVYSDVAKKPSPPLWPFARKFALYLKDHDLTINGFAIRHDLKQRSLNNWIRAGVKIPAEAVRVIAVATNLPIDYWLNPNAPYPPAPEAEGSVDELVRRAKTLSSAQYRDVFEMLGVPSDVDRTLALRRAARGR